jgi:putative DNA primase/helicase
MNKFFVWSGRHWRQDDLKEVEQRVKETQRSLYECALTRLKKLGDPGADEMKKEKAKKLLAVVKHCLDWEAQKKITAWPGVPILPAQLDADPFVLNCLNRTLDLKTGELLPHRREDLLSKLAPVEYDPGARCPLWLSCLDTWMDGRTGLIDYLQRVTGYALTGDVGEQCLWFFHGGGQNGKTVYLRTILEMLGDYAVTGVDDLLLQKRHQSHPTERASLFGRRFVVTIEQDQGRKLAEALMKSLTGGDKITARRMREDFWDFGPTHKIFLAANHKPEIQGQDLGTWRRIKLVPWDRKIAEDRKDTNLLVKLKAEWPGILAWAVRGCLAWQRDGLQEPPEVTDATAAYRAEQNLLGEFLTERCTINRELRVRAGVLHDAYEKWTGQTVTRNAFATLMEANGYRSVPDERKCKIYKGIGLNAE